MDLTCGICGKVFTEKTIAPHLRTAHNRISSKEYYDKYVKKEGEGVCRVCGKPTKYLTLGKGYKPHCGATCAQRDPELRDRVKETRLSKNGDEWNKDYKEKYNKTCQERYGQDSTNQLKTVQEKKTNTRMTKFGTYHNEYKKTYAATCLERYGVASTNQLDEVKQKKAETRTRNS